MSLPADPPRRHEAAQEDVDKLLRLGSRYCVDFAWLVERDKTPSLHDGFSFTYRGILRPEGRKVALKTFRSRAFGEEDHGQKCYSSGQWVLREVYLLCQLRHKNILLLLGITTTFDKTISIVSPWMDRNAHEYVQDPTIDPRPLILGIAKGLRYLHDHQPPVYHGDVKGDSRFSRVLVSPFSSTLRLTLPWMAPERLDFDLDASRVTPEVDVWAFGMTALELFTRRLPFHSLNQFPAVMTRITRGPPPDLPGAECTYSRLTEKWWRICSLCWKYDPSQRPTMLRIVEMIVDTENDTKGHTESRMEESLTENHATLPSRSRSWLSIRSLFRRK
ncbi:kinase-like domain-containing protein [Pisolithus orientalis]|uniref:kinase-like domain-containing protein n=1 Tax=Pisolithus orientalis TaxID=936130 RepID=UPI002224D32D|nr:kinase-like domain-containing protein [Pisolithus orientalis]KAI5984985.1 kinase-like domain-containing protein [Pisolithus orientalis]